MHIALKTLHFEQEALDGMLDPLHSEYNEQTIIIRNLWAEYEQGNTAESILVKDLDKFDMICQAFEYEKRT